MQYLLNLFAVIFFNGFNQLPSWGLVKESYISDINFL